MLSFSPGYHHMLTHDSINMDKYVEKILPTPTIYDNYGSGGWGLKSNFQLLGGAHFSHGRKANQPVSTNPLKANLYRRLYLRALGGGGEEIWQ